MNIEDIKECMLDSLKKNVSVEELDLIKMIISELRRAEQIHPIWPSDRVHQVAIVNEEAGEMIQAVLNETENRGSVDAIKVEAIQTAAMCIRFLKQIEESNENNKF